MGNYTSTTDLKAYIGTTSTADDTLLGNAISAAEAYIDSRCHRSFVGSTGTRYYRASDLISGTWQGGSGTVLYLRGELLSLGGLTNGDGTTIASTDCWTEPRNSPPYRYLRLKTAEAWGFDTDGEIAVSGTWGYSTAAPADIVDATKQLASYYYHLSKTQVYDVVANPETGTITVPKGVPASVERILKDGGYVRKLGIY